MKNQRFRLLHAVLLSSTIGSALGQGNNMFQSNVFGDQYLAPSPPLFPFAPRSVNIGTLPIGLAATLRVRGDQLPVTDPIVGAPALCTFRTDVLQEVQQSWWMYRDINPIGRIWNESGHRAFHVQSYMNKSDGEDRYSGLMLQNDNNDGMWSASRE